MKKYILAITLVFLYSSSVLATECSIQMGGGGKDSAVFSLKNNKTTQSNNIGGPWSFIRSTKGPCRFTLYNEKNYKGRKVQYGATVDERIASKDGRDKGGWRVRSLIITPLKASCSLILGSKPDKSWLDELKNMNSVIQIYEDIPKGTFIFNGPSSFSHLSGLSGVNGTSGDSSCRYTLYNDFNFSGRQMNLEKVNKPFRGSWRIRSIKITNNVSHSARLAPTKIKSKSKSPSKSKISTKRRSSYSTIKHVNGRCLDVAGGKKLNKTNIQIYQCNNSKSQKWMVTKKSEIKNIMGLCLDVAGGVNANKTNVQLYQCNGSDSQKWRRTGLRIRNVMGKCLDVNGRSNKNGANVQLYNCNKSGAQKWN